MLNAQVARKAIRNGQALADSEWYGGLASLFAFFALRESSGFLFFADISDTFSFPKFILFLVLGILCFYALYNLFVERNLALTTTGLSADANRQLIQAACKQLGWSLLQNTNYAVVATVPHTWYATYRAVCVGLFENGKIYLNVSNVGNTRDDYPCF